MNTNVLTSGQTNGLSSARIGDALSRVDGYAKVTGQARYAAEHFPAGIQGIAAAKYELVQALPADGIAVLNADDAHVRTFGRGREPHVRTFAVHAEATVRATEVESLGADGMRFTVHAAGASVPARIALLGEHNVYNALAAVAVGLEAGVPLPDALRALEELQPSDKRGELLRWNGAQLLNDTYNSNPRALDSMVNALAAVPADRRIVVAGEMLELGPEAASLHRCCGQHMRAAGMDVVLGVRGFAQGVVDGFGEGGVFVDTPEEAGAWMRSNVRAGDAVLLKASRGVRLERALAALQT